MKRFILYRFYQSTALSFAETVQENMLKIPESGLIHFLLYWLHYKKILTTTLINSIKK